MYDSHALKIFTDGSALENPGPGGFAGIVEYPEALGMADCLIFKEGYFETTNNRMELRAVIKALEYASAHARKIGVQRVIIVTDSLYVSENQSRAYTWRKNGWINLHGRSLENPDLWKLFLSMKLKVPVRLDIVWKKGKTSTINQWADREAKSVAKKPTKKDLGFRRGKISKATPEIKGAATMFVANGQVAEIRIYKKLGAGKTKIKVSFETLYDENLIKCFAYAESNLAHQLHRSHRYSVKFNTDPHNPSILEFTALD